MQPETETSAERGRKMKRQAVELLAPAGSFESMAAAIAAGADAVYIGGSKFGARAYADNLDEDRMLEAIDYAHLYGRKLYMTVNTLVKEEELPQLRPYLTPYYERGLDAAIVQDLGVFSYLRTHFPELALHASTQMTITGVYGARMLAAMGAQRIVTARELSLEEIRQIHEEADVEIESFVHGALCYCYSGQCLFSSMIGGRSGNRGRCAQTCRLPYEVQKNGKVMNPGNNQYVLSLKDLCTLELIPELIGAGVYSMKIEGRMKSPRYTAGVVSIYRKYIDRFLEYGKKGYRVDPEDQRKLLDLFDRGGFTQGYYRSHNGRDMVALREKPAFREGNQQLFDYLDQTYVQARPQIPVDGWAVFEEGRPAVFTVSAAGHTVTAEGEQVQSALNQPADEEKLRKQLNKTGNTPFVFETLELEIRGRIFVPVQALNQLRRQALEQLQREICGAYRRTAEESGGNGAPETDFRVAGNCGGASGAEGSTHMKLCVSLERPDCLDAVLAEEAVDEIYIDSTGFGPELWEETIAACHERQKKCCLILPHIFRQEARRYFRPHEAKLRELKFDGMVLRSMEEIGYLEETGCRTPMIFDASLYIWNSPAVRRMEEQNAARLTLPLELNSRELERLGCEGREMVVYGRLPMMVSAQCIEKTTSGCSRQETVLRLKDRMGKEFPVKNHCRFCYNTIYNSSPLSLAGQASLIRKLGPGSIRLQFSVETPRETGQICTWYADVFVRGIRRGEAGTAEPVREFTRGHLKRGVE